MVCGEDVGVVGDEVVGGGEEVEGLEAGEGEAKEEGDGEEGGHSEEGWRWCVSCELGMLGVLGNGEGICVLLLGVMAD